MDTIKSVCKRLWLWLTTNTYKPPPKQIQQRRAEMILQIIANLAIGALGIWFAWVEFGDHLFKAPMFWFLISIWGYLSATLFLGRWAEASQKTTNEKIDDLGIKFDDLIKEVRGLREVLTNKGGSNGGSKDKRDTNL